MRTVLDHLVTVAAAVLAAMLHDAGDTPATTADNFLYKGSSISSPPNVRRLFVMAFLVLLSRIGFAQDQERKLIDRLLRPDMELKNDAQNKKFIADRTSVQKQVNVGTFYVEQKSKPKAFIGTRELSAPKYGTTHFASEGRQANPTSPNEIPSAQQQIPPKSTTDSHTVHDATRSARGGAFAGERPFLDQGKSQKSLNQKNEPLTIDEIRELLNKNK